MEKMKFDELRAANRSRHQEWAGGGELPLSFRGVELAGEVGEACNEIKKLERSRLGIRGGKNDIRPLADELADVIVCVDLIAMDLGIDLSKAVRDKFNATSEKYDLTTRLP
jgi:NTP pyrophosphatase (non-canonical NTP hydrolase)